MKLTNQQIDALIAVCEQKHNKKNAAHNEAKQKEADKKNIGLVKEYLKIYKAIPERLKQFMYSRRPLTEKYLLDEMRGNANLVKFDIRDFRNKILIASIDSATMVELKQKLKIDLT